MQRAYKNKESYYMCVTYMVVLLRHLYLKSRRLQGDLGLRLEKTLLVEVKVKVKVHLGTGHEGLQWNWWYSSTFSS